MKRNLIVLLGVQGSGKGTVATGLCNIRDCDYVETGALFRGLDRTSELGAQIGAIIESGQLVPDNLTFQLVESNLSADRDVLTDGFPRTVQQAEWLIKWAAENDFTTKVVLLDIPKEVAYQRIQTRLNEGGGRKDDADHSAVERRLNTYYAETEPMVKFLRSAPGVQFFGIDGTQSKEKVFADVKESL